MLKFIQRSNKRKISDDGSAQQKEQNKDESNQSTSGDGFIIYSMPKQNFESFTTKHDGRLLVDQFTPVSTRIEDGVRQSFSRIIAREATRLVEQRQRRAIIHHGIVRCSGAEEIQDVTNGFIRNRTCQFIFVSYHNTCGGHVHTIHDCPYSNGSCRCFFGIIPRRKDTNRVKFEQRQQDSLANVVEYNIQAGRYVTNIKMGGTEWRCGLSFDNFPVGHQGDVTDGCEERRLLEEDEIFGKILRNDIGFFENTEGTNSVGVYENNRDIIKGGSSRKFNEREKRIDAIVKQIKDIGCAPFNEFHSTSTWMESNFKNLDIKSNEVRIALSRATWEMGRQTLYDYSLMYRRDINDNCFTRYHWGCHDKKQFYKLYMDHDSSFMMLKRLLIWQFYPASMMIQGNNKYFVKDISWKPAVFEFVKYLIEFIDGLTGKKNTLYIQSEPNAGKTLFLDALFDYIMVVGNMKHWNRSQQFATEELLGVKLGFWNEPNFEEGVIPELLKLLGGDRISINKKYETSKTARQIPIICTGNNYAFPSSPNFNERINHIVWKTSPFLIEVGKKRLHPIAIESLFLACEQYFEEDIRSINQSPN